MLVAHKGLHVHGRRVVEALLGRTQQERLRRQIALLPLGKLREDGALGGLQNAVHPAQDSEGQDHLAVFMRLVFAAKQVRHGPDKG
jgi:hypothetical protein